MERELVLKDKMPLINERIRFEKLQVINHEGQNLGVISRRDALRLSEEAGLDLVLIADSGNEGAPVAKIMDHGKLLYGKKKKAADARKKQKVIKIKEIKIRPKIGDHDLQIKLRQSVGFLSDGNRVKITLVFKGREVANKSELGEVLFGKVDAFFNDASLKNLAMEKDVKLGLFWSRIYYMKS